MRKVFSSTEVSEIALVRDALEGNGLGVTVQNEYSGRSAVPAFRPPVEVWVRNDADYDEARRIVVATIATLNSTSDAPPWTCPRCREENPQSYEVCWNCVHEKGSGSD